YLCHNIGNPFSDFISEMYQRRLDAKKAGDMVTDTIAKLTMNSLYGRFGLRKDRENIAFDLNQTGFQGKWNIEKNGKKIRLGTVPVELTTSFSNIAIAAYTTSYARIVNLNTAAPIAEKHLYYTDTDSFHVNTKMREGKGLGQLKLEYKAKQACFLLPKTYIVKTEDKDFAITLETDDPDSPTKSDKKVVMKGFNSRKIWRAFDIENFKMALDGNLKSLRIENEPKFATFKRALQKGKVLALLDAESRKINSKYTKRVIFKNNKGEYDTRPLLVTKTGDVK
ncbi:MAG: DNA polymerase, partial [Oligoflexales bacterium]